jgi:hypothetical protein
MDDLFPVKPVAMFSLFGKKKHKRLDDKVYLKRVRADQALVTDALKLHADGKQVAVVYFFEESFARIESQLRADGLRMLKADAIASNTDVRNAALENTELTFLFIEHHPDRKAEDDAIVALENVFEGGRPTIGFYAAMDEPLLLLFGTDKIAALMQKLGLGNDGDALADPMITRAIRNAQSKVSAKISGSVPCRSQEEWFRINLPGGI